MARRTAPPRGLLRRPNPAAGKVVGTGIAIVVGYPVAVLTWVALAWTVGAVLTARRDHKDVGEVTT